MIEEEIKNKYAEQSFEFVEEKDKSALFVNSEKPPEKSVPLNSYYYQTNRDDICFFRLHRDHYLFEIDEIGVDYSILTWHQIKVKSHCEPAMKQMIDSMKGMEEFIRE